MITIDESNFYKGNQKWIEEIKLDEEEQDRIYNWAKIDGKYYYIKSNFGKYHEILGQLIAESLNLKTAKYLLCKKGNYTYYMSPNFKEENHEYKRVYDLYNNIDDIVNKDLIEDVLKMTALDLFMLQIDRTGYNYLIDTKENRLAPLYDYSCCYFTDANGYKNYNNYLVNLYLNNLDINIFKEKYENIDLYLEIIKDTNYLSMLKARLIALDEKLSYDNQKFYTNKLNEGIKVVNKVYRA